MCNDEEARNRMLQLRPAADQDLMEMMSWIPDNDLQSFCSRYLEDADVKWILR